VETARDAEGHPGPPGRDRQPVLRGALVPTFGGQSLDGESMQQDLLTPAADGRGMLWVLMVVRPHGVARGVFHFKSCSSHAGGSNEILLCPSTVTFHLACTHAAEYGRGLICRGGRCLAYLLCSLLSGEMPEEMSHEVPVDSLSGVLQLGDVHCVLQLQEVHCVRERIS